MNQRRFVGWWFRHAWVPFAIYAGSVLAQSQLVEIAPERATREAIMTRLGTALRNVRFFAAPGALTGVAGNTIDGQGAIFYTDSSGRYLFAGMVIDLTEKQNLTAQAARFFLTGTTLGQEVPEDVTSATRKPVISVAGLDDLAYLEMGSGSKLVYAFVDPLCGHCRRAWEEIRARLDAGGGNLLRIRWVPVSIGSEQSTTLAAAAVALPTEKTLASMFSGQPSVATARPTAEGALNLERNQRFAEDRLHLSATPTFVIVEGGVGRVQVGYPGLHDLGL